MEIEEVIDPHVKDLAENLIKNNVKLILLNLKQFFKN